MIVGCCQVQTESSEVWYSSRRVECWVSHELLHFYSTRLLNIACFVSLGLTRTLVLLMRENKLEKKVMEIVYV